MKVLETTPSLAESRTGGCSKLQHETGVLGSGVFIPHTEFLRHLLFSL
jgi:hypothetical protein